MTLYTGSGSLPRHQYCAVSSVHVRKKGNGFEPCVWFGLKSYPGRAWGCHVMLEGGAVVRDLPLHALAHGSGVEIPWFEQDAQHWDCYGYQFAVHEYDFLRGLEAFAMCGKEKAYRGTYLFTAVPIGDAYTAEPEQAKEFMVIKLNHGRYTIQPTNRVLFRDASWTDSSTKKDSPLVFWPDDIKLQTRAWTVEHGA
jgi:predicted dienelactone hydrolase